MNIEELLSDISKDCSFERLIKYINSIDSGIYSNNCERRIRKLTVEEIESPIDYLDYDFDACGLIPVFDIYDNNFIAIDKEQKDFVIINTIDEIISDRGTVQEVVGRLG